MGEAREARIAGRKPGAASNPGAIGKKRRRLRIIVTVLCAVAFAIAALAVPVCAEAAESNPVLDIADGSIFLSESGYMQVKETDDSAGLIGSYEAYEGKLTITGTSSRWRIQALSGTHQVVFDNMSTRATSTRAVVQALRLGDDSGNSASVTLELKGENTLTGASLSDTAYTNVGTDAILIGSQSSLTIKGDGTLRAYGADSRAGGQSSKSGAGIHARGESKLCIADGAHFEAYGGNRNKSEEYNPYCAIDFEGSTLLRVEGGSLAAESGAVTCVFLTDDAKIEQIGGRFSIHTAGGFALRGEDSNSRNAVNVSGGELVCENEGTISPCNVFYAVNLTVSGDADVSCRATSGKPVATWSQIRINTTYGNALYLLGEDNRTITSHRWVSSSGVVQAASSNVWQSYLRIHMAKEGGNGTHALTIQDAGDGARGEGAHDAGSAVEVYAGTHPTQSFDHWEYVSGEGYFSDSSKVTTTYNVLFSDVVIRPVFVDNYALSVEGGTVGGEASGRFVPQSRVSLSAPATIDGDLVFDRWEIVSGSGTFADENSCATTFTTADEDTAIRAVYEQGYRLTVENGSGGGLYKQGKEVTIRPQMPEGSEFDHWVIVDGDGTLDDASAPNAKLTMGAGTTTVRAEAGDTGDASIIGDFVVTGGAEGVDYKKSGSDILDITGSGNYTVRLRVGVDSTSWRIRVPSGSPTITLSNVNITNQLPFQIQGSAGAVTVALDGENNFSRVNNGYAGIQKENDAELVITSAQGDGSTYGELHINVIGGTKYCVGAAIGGSSSHPSASNISIKGGTIRAIMSKQDSYAAAIGGAGFSATSFDWTGQGSATNIAISGGNIYAEAVYGAGIGGGSLHSASVDEQIPGDADGISISGGSVTAYSRGLTSMVGYFNPGANAIGAGQIAWNRQYGTTSNTSITGSPTIVQGDNASSATSANPRDLTAGSAHYVQITYANKIEGVTIDPAVAGVLVGAGQQFTATVEGTGNKTVTWSVSGNSGTGTSVSQTGLLSIGKDETADSLMVTVTSDADTSKSASAKVTVKKELLGALAIGGVAEVGQTLTANFLGNADEDTLAYQWLRDGEPIEGATSRTYEVVTADAGRELGVKVTSSVADRPGEVVSEPVSVALIAQEPLTFSRYSSGEVAVTYPGHNGATMLIALDVQGGSGNGEVEYTITEGDGVVRLWNALGEYARVLKAGTATITATKKGAGPYADATATLKITVNKAALSDVPDLSRTHMLDESGEQEALMIEMPPDAGAVTFTAGEKDDEQGIIADWSVSKGGEVVYALADNSALTEDATATLSVTVSSENYEDFAVPATITVRAREVPELAVESVAVTYNGEAVPSTAIKGTARNAEGQEIPGTWSWKDGAAPKDVADSGAYTVVFTPEDERTFTSAEVEVAVRILPAKLTVTANNAQVTYGAAAPEFSAEVVGYVSGEDASVLTGALAFACDYAEGSVAGDYEIVPSRIGAANYAIDFVPGVLTVAAAAPQVNVSVPVTAHAGNNVRVEATASNPFASAGADGVETPSVSRTTYAIDGGEEVEFTGSEFELAEDVESGATVVVRAYVDAVPGKYEAVVGQAVLTVAERADVSGDLEVSMPSWTFGDASPTPSYTGVTADGEARTSWYYTGTTHAGAAYASATAPTQAGAYTVSLAYRDLTQAGTASTTFTIAPRSIAGANVVLGPSLTFTGVEQAQRVAAVELGEYDVTYTVAGNIAQAAGTYELAVAGTGNFCDTVTVPYAVAKAQLTGLEAHAVLTRGHAGAAATVDLSHFVPVHEREEARFLLASHTENGLTSVALDGSVLTLMADNASASAESDEVVVALSGMANYEDAQVTVRVRFTDKAQATVAADAMSGTYNGATHAGFAHASASYVDAEGATQVYEGPFDVMYTGTTDAGAAYGPSDQAPVDAGSYFVEISVPDSVEACAGAVELSFAIEPAAYTVDVAGCAVQAGSGLSAIEAPEAAEGVAGQTVAGTFAWYADEACEQLVGEGYTFQGGQGSTVTLYWEFTPAAGQENYRVEPVCGAAEFMVEGYVPGAVIVDEGGQADRVVVAPDAQGPVDLPGGSQLNPDGSITLPGEDGEAGTGDDVVVTPAGDEPAVVGPDGTVELSGGGTAVVPGPDGVAGTDDDVAVELPAGSTVDPEGTARLPGGDVLAPNGDVTHPDGSITHPDGTVTPAPSPDPGLAPDNGSGDDDGDGDAGDSGTTQPAGDAGGLDPDAGKKRSAVPETGDASAPAALAGLVGAAAVAVAVLVRRRACR